jgi:DNA-binding MarR family transcriptional regulator
MARKTAAYPPLKLENQICFAVYSTAHAFNRIYKPLLDQLGLTYPQYLVMLVLWERSPQSVGSLGAKLHLDSGTLTPLLKRMEAAGLVTRQRDPDDERRVIIALTDPGRALRAQASMVPETLARELALSESDLTALRDAVQNVVAALSRETPPE